MKHMRVISITPAKCAEDTEAVDGLNKAVFLLIGVSQLASLVISSIAFDVNVDFVEKKRQG